MYMFELSFPKYDAKNTLYTFMLVGSIQHLKKFYTCREANMKKEYIDKLLKAGGMLF